MKDMSLWMASLGNHLRLCDITMPGSHDAGIYFGDAAATGVVKPSLAYSICQAGSIYEQCMWGSRFFDVRLKAASGQVKAYHQTAGQGAVGGTAEHILADVDAFLSSRGSEFVILRITKTKETDTDILNTISKSKLARRLYRNTGGNIALATVGELRGKAVCVFETQKFEILHPSLGFHPFAKWKGGNVIMGLQTCGAYSNESAIRKVFSKQIERSHEHLNHPRDHLFVLYWTQTGGNIFEHTTKERNDAKANRKQRATGGAHHNMDYMLSLLTNPVDVGRHGERWKVQPTTWADRREHMPNVVMYDFVNERNSEQIVMLNQPNLTGILVEKRRRA